MVFIFSYSEFCFFQFFREFDFSIGFFFKGIKIIVLDVVYIYFL